MVVLIIIGIFFISINGGYTLGYYIVDKEICTELKQNILKLRIGFKIIGILFFLPTFILTYSKIPFDKIFYKDV